MYTPPARASSLAPARSVPPTLGGEQVMSRAKRRSHLYSPPSPQGGQCRIVPTTPSLTLLVSLRSGSSRKTLGPAPSTMTFILYDHLG